MRHLRDVFRFHWKVTISFLGLTSGQTGRIVNTTVESTRPHFVSPTAHLWTISVSVLAAFLPLSLFGLQEYESNRVELNRL